MGHFRIEFQRSLVLVEDVFGDREVFRSEIGYRLAEDVTFKHRACFKDLPYLFRCERRNDRAAVRDDGDETFCSEMAESFADGNPARLKFAGDVVLAELLALAKTAS